jgi:hypothetical protein
MRDTSAERLDERSRSRLTWVDAFTRHISNVYTLAIHVN